MNYGSFKAFADQAEPGMRERGYEWLTAIGLQEVDGLTVSDCLLDLAARNIEGEISMQEVEALARKYHAGLLLEEDGRSDRYQEADLVAAAAADVLAEKTFSLTIQEYLMTHYKLFTGIYPSAGAVRRYNIRKDEPILNGDSVLYGNVSELKATLEYDLEQEKNFHYDHMSREAMIPHLARFVSGLWQIHPFNEGNTRTTAVFFIKYLRTLGFETGTDIFAEHSPYFRGALVRANYSDLDKGIRETTEYLELFLRNWLLGEDNPLDQQALQI